MMLSPAATPAAGTDTVVVVPVELAVAVPMSWTNAISACASDAARLNRNASASVATAARAGFPGEAARDVRGVSPAIARAANAATVRAHRRRIGLIGHFPFRFWGDVLWVGCRAPGCLGSYLLCARSTLLDGSEATP